MFDKTPSVKSVNMDNINTASANNAASVNVNVNRGPVDGGHD